MSSAVVQYLGRGIACILLASILCWPLASRAAELDPKSVLVKTPDEFNWRDATRGHAELYGDPKTSGLFIYINQFKPNRFGESHYHPNDRLVMVVAGAPWRGTGPIVDWDHATRVPKGTFMIDYHGKDHWDGTKDESGAYLIFGYGPEGQTPAPKVPGPYAGGDPSAVTFVMPDQIPWKPFGDHERAVLYGDPSKPGLYAFLSRWPKGSNVFSHPHFHARDRFVYVLDGTWWVGTGNKFDPANLTVPVKPGAFVTEFGKGVHWDGAKDDDVTLLIIGEGPLTTTRVEEVK